MLIHNFASKINNFTNDMSQINVDENITKISAKINGWELTSYFIYEKLISTRLTNPLASTFYKNYVDVKKWQDILNICDIDLGKINRSSGAFMYKGFRIYFNTAIYGGAAIFMDAKHDDGQLIEAILDFNDILYQTYSKKEDINYRLRNSVGFGSFFDDYITNTDEGIEKFQMMEKYATMGKIKRHDWNPERYVEWLHLNTTEHTKIMSLKTLKF